MSVVGQCCCVLDGAVAVGVCGCRQPPGVSVCCHCSFEAGCFVSASGASARAELWSGACCPSGSLIAYACYQDIGKGTVQHAMHSWRAAEHGLGLGQGAVEGSLQQAADRVG